MNADQVREYVNAKWPQAMSSPVAVAIATGIKREELLTVAGEAAFYAQECVEACNEQGIPFCLDTLTNNIASNFPDLDYETCIGIAQCVPNIAA